MALVRCPSCGRVADGTICFACGHEWGAEPTPGPVVSRPPSVSLDTLPPSSPSMALRPPTPPPDAVDDMEVDLDFDVESVESVSQEPSLAETGVPDFGALQGDAMVSFSPATGFGTGFGASSGFDASAFGSSPAAMPDVSSDSTKPVLGAFSDAFADAPAHVSEMPSVSPALDEGGSINPWDMAGPSFAAASDRAPSSAFPIPPETPSPEPLAPMAMAMFPSSIPEDDSPDSMDSHPTRNVSKFAQQALAAARLSQVPIAANGQPVASWETNPTMAISAADAHALLASAAVVSPDIAPAADDIPPAPPVGLSRLFESDAVTDGSITPNAANSLDVSVIEAALPIQVTSSSDEVGDIFNFSLEPGSTLDLSPEHELSPFSTDHDGSAPVHERPMVGAEPESPSDVTEAPPEPAAVNAAVADDGAVHSMAPLNSGAVDFASTPLAVPSQWPATALVDDDAHASPREAIADLPAPPMMDFSTDDGLPAPPPLSAFLAETRAPFQGLGMSIEPGPAVVGDDLPAPPQMDFNVPTLDPAWFSDPPATGPVDEASFADVSFDDAVAAGPQLAAAAGGVPSDASSTSVPPSEPTPSLHQPIAAFETLPLTATLSLQVLGSNSEHSAPPPIEETVPRGPPLSSRVGMLAESLEEAGSIAEAALLYEVQATLNTMGL